MTDRELLELAAKAAGINKKDAKSRIEFNQWNPLESDGDALRLAVKWQMCVDVFDEEVQAGCLVIVDEKIKSDPYAATRRAIVRAAAEIGKGMK